MKTKISILFRNIIPGVILGCVGAFASVPVQAQDGSTLQQVRDKGFVQCGVSQGLPGFSNADDAGNWTGIDVDVCRAVAAAVFHDADAVKYTPLSAKERFTALQSGEVDILSRNTTWTLQRDTGLGIVFTGVNYYDGQGFMVRDSLRTDQGVAVSSALQLNGASVCTNTGTTTELNVADYFRANNMEYELVAFEKADEVVVAYDAERCDVYTTDQSGLYAQRLKMRDPAEQVVLPEVISKEPLGPSVRIGDATWASIVRWTLFAMINAEELGITSGNIDSNLDSSDPAILRFVGKEGSFGENMGLTNDWAYHIVKQVGNYAETFDRHVGPDTPLKIERGLNALWSDGGILYAPPIR